MGSGTGSANWATRLSCYEGRRGALKSEEKGPGWEGQGGSSFQVKEEGEGSILIEFKERWQSFRLQGLQRRSC